MGHVEKRRGSLQGELESMIKLVWNRPYCFQVINFGEENKLANWLRNYAGTEREKSSVNGVFYVARKELKRKSSRYVMW